MRRFAATLMADGRVLMVGGHADGSWNRVRQLYDPKTGWFVFTSPMATSRACHTAALLGSGRVLIAGGLDAGARSRRWSCTWGDRASDAGSRRYGCQWTRVALMQGPKRRWLARIWPFRVATASNRHEIGRQQGNIRPPRLVAVCDTPLRGGTQSRLACHSRRRG